MLSSATVVTAESYLHRIDRIGAFAGVIKSKPASTQGTPAITKGNSIPPSILRESLDQLGSAWISLDQLFVLKTLHLHP